jgi:L-ascorbate metabolism protein UlaG (beta-lactamase superfamily)
MAAEDVTLEWFGCATFRLTVDGTVIFLDAYIDRAPGADGTGLTADEVEAADWILVGHSHFDHLWGAERIARRTGATVVGSYETVRLMAANDVPDAQLMAVSGGERVQLGEDLYARVYPSLHSCVWTDAKMPAADETCLGDLDVVNQERLARLARHSASFAHAIGSEGWAHTAAARREQPARGDGGALVYVIETPQGRLLYQDTSGHWTGILDELQVDAAILAAAGRANIDGEPIQGSLADFIATEAAALDSAEVILCHHDDWLPGFSRRLDVTPIKRLLAERVPETTLVEMGYLQAHRLFHGFGV